MNKRNYNSSRPAAAGLTLVELMVASAIIVLLILAVGRIITQVQQVVTVAQTGIRLNAKATAMKDAVAEDLRTASQNGFICITQPKLNNNMTPWTSNNACPQIFVFSTGITSGMLPPEAASNTNPAPARGLASVSALGLAPYGPKNAFVEMANAKVDLDGVSAASGNNLIPQSRKTACDTGNEQYKPLIWHARYVLNGTNNNTQNVNTNKSYDLGLPNARLDRGDIGGLSDNQSSYNDIGFFQELTRRHCNDIIDLRLQPASTDGHPWRNVAPLYWDSANMNNVIYIPPRNLTDINSLWKALATDALDLSIMWTDGTMCGDKMAWAGIAMVPDDDGTANGKFQLPYKMKIIAMENQGATAATNWRFRLTSADSDVPNKYTEYNVGSDNQNGARYRVLFSHDKAVSGRVAWPVAIKIRFRLSEGAGDFSFTNSTGGNIMLYEIICPVGQ